MTELFSGAISQYIDDNGKARMVNYKVKGGILSLMTSPIPPLNLPNEREVLRTTKENAIKFVKDRKLQISSQDGSKDSIKGLWVEMQEENSEIYYGYIPILSSKPIENVEFAEETKLPPLEVKTEVQESELQVFRRNRKIAEFLKKYTLYTYALHPEEFDRSWFVVDPDHTYDIESLDKKLTQNDVMYDEDGYLIVQSDEIADRLMGYLNICLANDRPGVLNLAGKSKIEDYYQTVSDFRSAPNQLIFTSENGVLRWKRELARAERDRTVSQNLHPGSSEPYFYKTPKINKGALHIIQNVKDGSLENAKAVSYKWIKDRVNIGYSPDKTALPENISSVSYTNNGPVPGGKRKGETEEFVPVIFYEDGSYGAILFLA